MLLFVVLGVVVLMSLIVLGVLFFMLGKEGQNKEEGKAVPLTDIDQLKKELATGILESPASKLSKKGPELIPVFEPKVAMPTQDARTIAELDSYKQRAQELEVELKGISLKAESQSMEAKQMIETLTEENESLKRQKVEFEQAREKLIELQGDSSNLKAENLGLQSRLDESDARMRLLEEEMTTVRVQMGEEIAKANAAVAELNHEKDVMLSLPKPDPDAALKSEMEALQSEMTQLKQKKEELESTNQRLRDTNTHLMEKNDLLQYEMIKARAQSSGLERVSFNYKNQIEDFFKKMNAAQAAQEQLSQVKNRLEGVVEQIKSENEELVKKDQLFQFELEKNRSRLQNLERENEMLKAGKPPNDSL